MAHVPSEWSTLGKHAHAHTHIIPTLGDRKPSSFDLIIIYVWQEGFSLKYYWRGLSLSPDEGGEGGIFLNKRRGGKEVQRGWDYLDGGGEEWGRYFIVRDIIMTTQVRKKDWRLSKKKKKQAENTANLRGSWSWKTHLRERSVYIYMGGYMLQFYWP